ncbi:MAG: hypothetical protein AAGG50_02090 [Bacteroidota bacterium]
MLSLRLPSYAAGACALALTLLLSACDFATIQSDLEDAAVVRMNIPAASAEVSISFTDAATGLPVSSPVALTITGDEGAQVVDPIFFEPIAATTTEGGTITLAVADGTLLSAETPARFEVIAQADGYVTTGRSVAVTKTGTSTVDVQMLATGSAAPAGVSLIADAPAGSADNQGRVRETVVIETAPDSETGLRAVVTVPGGAVLTDAQDRTLRGALQAMVAYHSPRSPKALALLPGGFESPVLEYADGRVARDQGFVSAGFVAFEVSDASGRRAARLSTPMEVAMGLPEDFVNPETGHPLAPGDQLPVWGYDATTGRWVEAGFATIPAARTASAAALDVTILYETFDTLQIAFASDASAGCEAGFSIRFDGLPADLPARIRAYASGYAASLDIVDGTVTFGSLPAGVNELTAELLFEDEVIGSRTFQVPCGASVSVSATPPSGRVIADISTKVECTAEKLELFPSGTILVQREGVAHRTPLTLKDGQVRVNGVVPGATYTGTFSYVQDGRAKQHTLRYVADGAVEDGVLRIEEHIVDNRDLCDRL